MPCSMLFKWTLVLRLPGELFSLSSFLKLRLFDVFAGSVSKVLSLKEEKALIRVFKEKGGRSLSLVAVRAR